MSWLRIMEEKMGDWWEGFGRKGVKATIQPVEIAKKLLREMSAHQKVSVKRVYVPNRFLVHLSVADWNALCAMEQALTDELAAYLVEKADERGYTMVGKPQVKVEVDENLPTGQVRVHSHFSEEAKPEKADSEATRPFRPVTRLEFRVVRGPDAGLSLTLTEDEIVIGRRPTCDLALTDANVSRQHAVVERHGDIYWLHDLGSTNGTLVNGQRVERQALRPGDCIQLGDSELVVEVS